MRRKIKIEWAYPLSIESFNKKDVRHQNGLYCIYQYKNNNKKLIYIGKTEDTFENRMKSHNYWIQKYDGIIKVSLGFITYPKSIDADIVDIAESALIYEMQPIENTQKTKSYSYIKDYEIHNLRYRGTLKSNISTYEHPIKE